VVFHGERLAVAGDAIEIFVRHVIGLVCPASRPSIFGYFLAPRVGVIFGLKGTTFGADLLGL